MSRTQYTYRPPFVSSRWADLSAPRDREVWGVDGHGFPVCRIELYRPTHTQPTHQPYVRRDDNMVNIVVTGNNTGGFKGLETGIYNARCDLIADLGMQETSFGEKHKVYIRFAVPEQELEDKDGNKFQMSIGTTLTASLSKKANLRKMLESWRGRPFSEEELESFNLTNLLNAPATLVVGSYLKEGEERAKLDNVIKCKAQVGALIRTPASFSVDSSAKELAEAPEWIREKIEAQRSAAGEAEQQNGAAHQADEDAGDYVDDIPF